MTSNSRAAALSEAADALTAKACQLSEQAEEEMRRDLEDQAQVWHEAAAAVRRLINRPRRLADGTQPAETERCAHCTHPKGDHDGRADHRAKYPPHVAGDPWCHTCNSPCDYAAAGARQDGAQR